MAFAMKRKLSFDSTVRNVDPRRILLPTLCLVVVMSGISGCASSLLNMAGSNAIGSKFASLVGKDKKSSLEKEDDNDFDTSTKIETPLLSDYISVTGNNVVVLRGVGLVTGLDGTGGDPPPSHYRKELLDEMARIKVPNPQQVLASRNTALVTVIAYLPAMVREGQRFDVRVALPPNSEATSLKGGTLLETRLTEEATVSGRNLKGHKYGIAQGAILTALGDGGKANSGMLRRGSIPGGAVSSTERDLEIILRNEFRGSKTSHQIASVISRRLHHYNRIGQRIPMAEAKTDMMIELKVHPIYRNNFPRYQHMIRSIAYKESDVSRRLRIEQLSREILEPQSAKRAALALEAVGTDSIPFLQAALTSDNLEVRFHAAQALAYMEDSSGVSVLQEAAEGESAFRVYALAALSVIDDADAVIALRELMSSENLETRYGAVRALKEKNPHDPALGTQNFPRQFVLHAVESTSKPAVHVVRYRSPEVVVFGSQQTLRMPAVLNAGNRIRVMGRAGDKTVTVTKYRLNAEPERHTASTNLVDILHAVAALGATYPDVVQMLLEADDQKVLTGDFGVDRLPQAGRTFQRQSNNSLESSEKEARLGTPSHTPGLFDRLEDAEQRSSEESDSAMSRLFDANSEELDEPEKTTQADELLENVEGFLSEDADDAIEKMNLSEEAVPMEVLNDLEDNFEFEETDFKEPIGSKMRRLFTSPFNKKSEG